MLRNNLLALQVIKHWTSANGNSPVWRNYFHLAMTYSCPRCSRKGAISASKAVSQRSVPSHIDTLAHGAF